MSLSWECWCRSRDSQVSWLMSRHCCSHQRSAGRLNLRSIWATQQICTSGRGNKVACKRRTWIQGQTAAPCSPSDRLIGQWASCALTLGGVGPWTIVTPARGQQKPAHFVVHTNLFGAAPVDWCRFLMIDDWYNNRKTETHWVLPFSYMLS